MVTTQDTLNDLKNNSAKKLTPQRREILKVLMDSGGPETANEVYEKVTISQPNISKDTVYRNLLMLTQEGLVSQINLQNKGKAKFEFVGKSEHYHAICLDCGDILCVENIQMPKKIKPPEGDPDFKIKGFAFEIYGQCGSCQKLS